MKIVIDIGEAIYKECIPYKDTPIISNLANYNSEIIHAVANGTPLQNGRIMHDILELPSVEPERKPGKWIPVSERLPEPDTFVLTYHRHLSFDYQYVSSIDETTGEWSGFCGNLSDEVLAWMPLPDAYKGETT